jgi:hypothetical protein
MYKGMIPFDKYDNVMSYTSRQYPDKPDLRSEGAWRENYVWEDELQLIKMEKGRSAAHFIFQSRLTGKTYVMFMTDLTKFLLKGTMTAGIIKGKWAFTKKGQNFGVIFIESECNEHAEKLPDPSP